MPFPQPSLPSPGIAGPANVISAVTLPAVSAEPLAREPSLGTILASLQRYRWLIAGWVLAAMVLASVAIFRLEPSYRATALVALATRQIQFSELSAVVSSPLNALDTAVARSEVEILESEELARRVVQDLRLAEEPDFAAKPPRLAGLAAAAAALTARLGGPGTPLVGWLEAAAVALTPAPQSPAERLNAVVQRYRRHLSVFNDGRSYVVSVSFEASDPALAARIANRHVKLYIEAQRQSKDQALVSATRWLDREVAELATRLQQAEAAVQSYRERHRLFAPGGTPVTQQQLADLNGELAMARADLAQRNARLRRALDAQGDGALTEIVTSDAIARLREQELIARRRVAEAADSLGPRHPTLAAMRAEVTDIQGMIGREQEKIIRSLEGEAAIAREREAELRRIVAELEDRMAGMERAEAGARDLEREANAIRALYESLLSRQKQVATQVGIQQPDAQLASAASVPHNPSFPDKPLLLAVGLIGATASGAGLALFLDRRRKGLESLAEVEAATGLRRVVALPGVPRRRLGKGAARMALPDQVAARPKSVAAEAVRTLRNALALRGESLPRLLAVTSSLPGEGKTSVALALARSLAASGHRVLLVEGDLRRGTLARLHRDRPLAERGIIGVLEGRLPLEAAVVEDRATPLRILPAEGEAEAPQDLLVPERFGQLIAAAGRDHDHVIVDTPPVGAVSDALLIARCVEATLLVVRADTTPRDCVAATVRALHEADLPIAAAVLNATEPTRGNLVGYAGRRQHAALLSYLRG
jgi:capsular exopolysaccharide synthesis family protein